MSNYSDEIASLQGVCNAAGSSWNAINPESAARMRLQNRFRTGLEIAQYTADIMRRDMEEYDADSSQYTQSLGCWHGFIGQQKMISIKKHLEKARRYEPRGIKVLSLLFIDKGLIPLFLVLFRT